MVWLVDLSHGGALNSLVILFVDTGVSHTDVANVLELAPSAGAA